MMQHSNSQKAAQKGWLSRWTRKQWSRHWFVLKNGSLTYYRGPAAELCSFLDGVLDLSLIKHIEVPPPTEEQVNGVGINHHHQVISNHHSNNHHINNNNNNSNNNNHHHTNNASQQQFTFSLKMWNGECHLLGAGSAAERSLWLEAINACTGGADDDAATDSASSSDSSPTSHLSAKSGGGGGDSGARRLWNQQRQQEQLALDQLALSLRSAVARRREQDLVLELNKSRSVAPEQVVAAVQKELLVSEKDLVVKPVRHSGGVFSAIAKQEVQHLQQQQQPPVKLKQQDQAEVPSQLPSEAQRSSQLGDDPEQAFKRRLMCVQSSQQQQQQQHHRCEGAISEPKLITRRPGIVDHHLVNPATIKTTNTNTTYAGYLAAADGDSHELHMNSSSSGSESELDSDEDDHHLGEPVLVEPTTTQHPPLPPSECSRLASSNGANHSSATTCQQQQSTSPSAAPSSLPDTCQVSGKQKKRVTFDLSLSSQHQLSASSSAASTSGDDDEDVDDDDDNSLSSAASSSSSSSSASSPSSSSLKSSASSSEDELDERAEPPTGALDRRLQSNGGHSSDDLIDLSGQPSAPPVAAELSTGIGCLLDCSKEPHGSPTDGVSGHQPMDINHQQVDELQVELLSSSSQVSGGGGVDNERLRPNTTDELEAKLEQAQVSIGLLEAKLSSSYANHSQLELSYKRLQADLLKGDELHRLELARLEARVDELQRELAAGELKLAEAREKLIGYERRLTGGAGSGEPTSEQEQQQHTCSSVRQQSTTASRSLSLSNWLRASQQVVQQANQSQLKLSAGKHLQLQQPLHLLMHHQVKHSLAANQQTLGLKLLNHSKQIQRKLNELELKVDRIQSVAPESSAQ